LVWTAALMLLLGMTEHEPSPAADARATDPLLAPA
jgi:hypothetical protein